MEQTINTIDEEIELFKRIADNENRVTIQNIGRVKRMYEKVKPLIQPDRGLADLNKAKSKITEFLQLLCFEHERASNQTGKVPKFTGPVYEQYRGEVNKSIKGFEHLLTRVNTLIDKSKEKETDWNGLRLDMIENGFIQKADEKLFNMALNYKVYPKNRDRIVWKESRRQAAVFAARLSMDINEFNKCFEFPGNGRPLHKTDFIDLLADKEYKIHEILRKHGK